MTNRAFLAALALATACTDSTGPESFLGVWRGSNSVFQLFQLNVQSVTEAAQGSDTVRGAAQFVFAEPPATVADTDFGALPERDSLAFLIPGPPSLGGALVSFAGQRRGSIISGIANGVPITLRRQ